MYSKIKTSNRKFKGAESYDDAKPVPAGQGLKNKNEGGHEGEKIAFDHWQGDQVFRENAREERL